MSLILVPSYDLFASARKAVFPAPTVTGVHRLRNAWSAVLSQLVDNYVSFTSKIRDHNVQPRLVGGGMGER